MGHHRLGVLVGGGVRGRPDRREGVQQVGAEDAGDGLFDGLGLVRIEDSGVAAGEDQRGGQPGLPPVTGRLGGEVGKDQGVDGGPQEGSVVGASGEVGVFGAGFLQHLGRRVEGGAA
ncbi:hypothetical protein [Streptomyces sp. NPDC002573]|uniref:hypothetical protein n=1 Tax=Streptomyces sp. NPDC002573 TaxID=3364651 RepID=UPI003686BC49